MKPLLLLDLDTTLLKTNLFWQDFVINFSQISGHKLETYIIRSDKDDNKDCLVSEDYEKLIAAETNIKEPIRRIL